MLTLKQTGRVTFNVDLTGDPILTFPVELQYDDVIDTVAACLVPRRGWMIGEDGKTIPITKRLPSELVRLIGPYPINQFWQTFGARVADSALQGCKRLWKETYSV